VVVYSFFKGALDLAEALLRADGLECCRFDGDDDAEARQQQLDAFQGTPSIRCLLLSMFTGGVGLNIAQANHGVFLDVWWNPFMHRQCEDRMHRIGQTRPVDVQYVLAHNSFDQVIYSIGHTKRTTASRLLGGGDAPERQSNAQIIQGLLAELQKMRRERGGASSGGGPPGAAPGP